MGLHAAMRPLLAAGALLLAVATTACATYRDDLDRAVAHYNSRAYDRAVVLFDVLEPDLDSLSPAERARYAYYRGMSHFLLEQRRHARHWLGNAAAREKAQEGALHPEELAKLTETLDDLNEDRWGGAKTPAAEEKSCQVDLDCVKGQFCDGNVCKKAPGGEDEGGAEAGEAEAGGDGAAKDDAPKDEGI